MGVYHVPWDAYVMREANQFWFYALAFSLLGECYELLLLSVSMETSSKSRVQKKKNDAKSRKRPPAATHKSALVKSIAVDILDIFIPAEFLNWMPTGDLVVGMAMMLSTLLAAADIWARV